jgi:phage terminase large subunit-like protein
MEVSFHLTGEYPVWWEGRKFVTPPRVWVGGPNSEHVRDNAQRLLFGTAEEEGTGAVPGHAIAKIERSRGIKNAIDYALVRHRSGGLSYVNFKSYDQETDAWSGDTLSFLWYDEEPPLDKFLEGLTRTNTGDNGRPGMIFLTLTPLLGMTKVARRFHPRPTEDDSAIVRMGLKDAKHYSEEDIKNITATYEPHVRKARVEGIPQLGEGAVFQPPKELWTIDPPERQPWWIHLGGIDFGWDHPCGAVEVAWDRDNDICYALREFRQSQAKTAEIASVLRKWGDTMPWSWPHDGYQHDRQSGQTVKELFNDEGMRMLPIHAQFEDGSMGVEAGILEMNDRLSAGRLKISLQCPLLIEEMETYHRDKGKIVKEADDLVCALRYAIVMRRYASYPGGKTVIPKIIGGAKYDPFQ